MSATVVWFILFCVVLGAEMMLSTIYLLAFAAGLIAAALCSLCSDSTALQVAVAAVVTALGAVAVFFIRRRLKAKNQDRDEVQNPDEGREISVGKVVDNVARVSYRGTTWDAVSETEPLVPGIWLIDRIDGTRLIVRPRSAAKS